MSKTEPRQDFLSHVIRKVKNGEIGQEELTAHASTLVYVLVLPLANRKPPASLTISTRLAGGETVSTFLAACTFYLLKTPQHLHRLQTEIRDTFTSYEHITATQAQQLPFLQAVISEGLRMYPPGPHGFPRISPGGYIDGYYVPAGVSHCYH